MDSPKNRRQFLTYSAGAGAAILTGSISKALNAACALTPPQTPGPFYPGEGQFHIDNDLTLLPGNTVRAKGQTIHIHGQVLDPSCNAVAGATVEIWQACASGRYNNKSDPNPAALDSNFKYWGEAITDAGGNYVFKTIIPGAYPADTNWMRPPHIHFKVSKLGYNELVTQMYFKGNELNGQDLILQNVPATERDSVVIEFTPSPWDASLLSGTFNITLSAVRGSHGIEASI